MGNQNNRFTEHDEDRISGLLGSLNRVEAPSDFDFGVKARIANGRPVKAGLWFPASVRVAAPLALTLAVGGYFGLNYYYSVNQQSVPEVAVMQPIATPVLEPVTTTTVPVTAGNQFVANGPNVVPNLVDRTSITTANLGTTPLKKNVRTEGSSYDEAVRESRRILQNGIDANARTGANATVNDIDIKVPTTQILALLGISARFDGPAWRVIAVGANNPAVRSLIKPGDVIESIDGQPLNGRTFVRSRFSGQSVTVQRDGRSLRIDLRP